ncbi:MAG: superoxide dismutase [Mn] [Arsenophonus endosymbiont of Ceratovacuna japonica]
MSYTLPLIPYEYNALEPYFDERTMKIHHTKHHQTYINNTNNIVKDFPNLNKLYIDDLIQNLDKVSEDKYMFLRNNAGGHANHSMFWNGLKIGTKLHGELKSAIERDFVSIDNFKKIFETEAITRFGSGWVWLVLKLDGRMMVISTSNQDNPLMGKNISRDFSYPILGCDVWEHSYYLKYQNNRLEYIKAFWSVVNWDEAERRFIKKIR